MTTVKFPFYARLCMILVSIALIIVFLEMAKDIIIPLVFGLLIAILLYPFSRYLENKLKFRRGASTITSLLVFLALLTAFFNLLILQIVSFTEDLPDLKVRFGHIMTDIHHWVHVTFKISTAQQNDYINKSLSNISESAAQSVSNIFVSVTGILFLIIFVFIFSFFVLYYRRLLLNFILKLFSDEHQDKVREVVMESKSMINSYVGGLLIEMAIMSVANTALLLALGIQYAVLLGVVAAVLNIIPYLGIYTAIVLTMFVTFANASGTLALEVGLGLFILHFIDSNILMPRVVGARVKMNPFITIVAVIVGEFIWGIPGMFLFIPIAAVIKLICERVEGLEAWSILIGLDERLKITEKIVIETVPVPPPPEEQPDNAQSNEP